MKTYRFDWLNGSEAIVDPTIIKDGFAGGSFINNESQGDFCVGLLLQNAGGTWSLELKGNTMPVDFTVEEIDIWIEETLQQYEI
ncbi:MAG: hypothetical protein NZ735_00845 [Candidatus Marinimicrobia bacterium]|nr:hypothetical protein [Candidatus Neomarinimicrobiota bacterium]